MVRRKRNGNSPKPLGNKGFSPSGGRTDAPRRPTPPGGTVWLYGRHAVEAALANPARTWRRLVVTEEARATLAPDVAAKAEPADRAQIDRLLPEDAVHQGFALLADPLDEPDLQDVAAPLPGRRNVVLVLDRVTDPRNVGAILRSASAFGARAVVVTERHAPEATGALAKAASGALDRVPLCRVTNLARCLDDLAALGYWRIGMDAGAEKTLATVAADLDKAVLVLGAEGEGLRRLTAERCDFLARLPIAVEAESLNVSNAAAVALYELARA